VLKPGGLLSVVVPNLDWALQNLTTSTLECLHLIYGAQEYEHDYHYNGFTPEMLRSVFEGLGLRDVQVLSRGKHLHVTGRVPGG